MGQERMVEFNGVQHQFPADATDAEISAVLNAVPHANSPKAPKARTWKDLAVDVAHASLDALPAAGAIVGGAVAASGGPATALAGAALGAGAGRGLRDLVAEGTGIEAPTSPVGKAARIGLDTAVTAVTPGAIEAVRTPIATVKGGLNDVLSLLPARFKEATVKVFLPMLEQSKSPTPLLTRPAWQVWEQNMPSATQAEIAQLRAALASPKLASNPQARAAIEVAIKNRMAK